MRELFPSARGLEMTWHSIVKIQQSLYREVCTAANLPAWCLEGDDMVLLHLEPVGLLLSTLHVPPVVHTRCDLPRPLMHISLQAPGLDPFRPDQTTPVPNFFLAGSYTKQACHRP